MEDSTDDEDILKQNQMPVFNPNDLVGRTFLMDQQEDGQRHRARIVQAIEDLEAQVEKNTDRIKFRVSVNEDEFEDVLTYNEVLRHIKKDEESDILWKFKCITAHQGPLPKNHPDY